MPLSPPPPPKQNANSTETIQVKREYRMLSKTTSFRVGMNRHRMNRALQTFERRYPLLPAHYTSYHYATGTRMRVTANYDILPLCGCLVTKTKWQRLLVGQGAQDKQIHANQCFANNYIFQPIGNKMHTQAHPPPPPTPPPHLPLQPYTQTASHGSGPQTRASGTR